MPWYVLMIAALAVNFAAYRWASPERTALAAGAATVLWLVAGSGTYPVGSLVILPAIIVYLRRSVLTPKGI